MDVIEIMVTDHSYAEFGYEKQAIQAAVEKLKLDEDPSFKELLEKLESYQKNTFLN